MATLGQLGRPCSIAEAKAALVAGYSRALGVRFRPGVMSEPELELARRLYDERYRLPEWNLAAPQMRREDKGHLA